MGKGGLSWLGEGNNRSWQNVAYHGWEKVAYCRNVAYRVWVKATYC